MNSNDLQDVIAPFFQTQLVSYRAGNIPAQDAMRHAVALGLCGRSGAGKDTLRAHLLVNEPRLGRVITTTTRSPEVRGGQMEVPGKDYFFVTLDEFEAQWSCGALLEKDTYAGNHYGSSVEGVLTSLAFGKIPILQITGRGVEAALLRFDRHERSRGIFVSAPRDVVEARIRMRAASVFTDVNEKALQKRLDEGDNEERQFRPIFSPPFGEVVVNQYLGEAQNNVLLHARRMVSELVAVCQRKVLAATG